MDTYVTQLGSEDRSKVISNESISIVELVALMGSSLMISSSESKAQSETLETMIWRGSQLPSHDTITSMEVGHGPSEDTARSTPKRSSSPTIKAFSSTALLPLVSLVIAVAK